MADSTSDDRATHVVASYATYDAACRAIDVMSRGDFPVERVTIAAGNVRFVEHVTRRPGYGSAAATAASTGAVTGVVLGFVLGLFSVSTPITSGLILAAWGALLGAVIGAAVGALGHLLQPRSGSSGSVHTLQAGRYDVVAPADLADEARRLLAQPRQRRAA